MVLGELTNEFSNDGEHSLPSSKSDTAEPSPTSNRRASPLARRRQRIGGKAAPLRKVKTKRWRVAPSCNYRELEGLLSRPMRDGAHLVQVWVPAMPRRASLSPLRRAIVCNRP